MNGVKRTAFLIIAAISLIGCETLPSTASSEQLSSIKRVGVVSAVGDRVFDQRLGFLAFGNKSETADIFDWALDHEYESKITSIVAATTQLETVELSVDKAGLFASYPADDAWPRKPRQIDFETSAPIFREIASENDIDALIVLGSDSYDVGQAGVWLSGVSIFSDKNIAGVNSYYWFVARLYLVDGNTGEAIASRLVGKNDIFGPRPVTERAPEELRGKTISEYTPEERASLRETFVNIIDDEIWRGSVAALLTAK